jgi:hypothetical protein
MVFSKDVLTNSPSRMPASIEISIQLVVCIDKLLYQPHYLEYEGGQGAGQQIGFAQVFICSIFVGKRYDTGRAAQEGIKCGKIS